MPPPPPPRRGPPPPRPTTTTTRKRPLPPPSSTATTTKALATRDGHERRRDRALELVVVSARRAVERETQRVTRYKPPPTPEELEQARQEMIYQKRFGLKGPWRPATEVFPELYPELEQAKREAEEAEEASYRDLTNEFAGRFWDAPELRELVRAQVTFAYALVAQSMRSQAMVGGAFSSRGAARHAVAAFRAALDMDPRDPLGCRRGFVLASLDDGNVDQANELVDAFSMSEPQVPHDDGIAAWDALLLALVEELEDVDEDDNKDDDNEGLENEDQNEDESERRLLDLLHHAMSLFPEIGLLLAAPPPARATCIHMDDVDALTRDERDARTRSAVSSGEFALIAGRCDGGALRDARALAVAYVVSRQSVWDSIGDGAALEWVSANVLSGVSEWSSAFPSTASSSSSLPRADAKLVSMFEGVRKRLPLP